jgi:hypothetical protein
MSKSAKVVLGPSLKVMCRTEEMAEDIVANREAMREIIAAAVAGDREGVAERFAEVMGRKIRVAIGGCRQMVAEQMAVELEEREEE